MDIGQPFYNYGSRQNNGYVAPPQNYYNAQQIPQPQPQPLPIPPKTNKVFVTSLIDALSRTPEPNTEFVYLDQDNPFMYQVTIDMQGRKSYKTFEIKEVTEQNQAQASALNIDLTAYATKDDLKALENKIVTMASSLVTPTAKAKVKTEKAGGDE